MDSTNLFSRSVVCVLSACFFCVGLEDRTQVSDLSFFVQGALSHIFLTESTNPSKGLANGSTVYTHSLTFCHDGHLTDEYKTKHPFMKYNKQRLVNMFRQKKILWTFLSFLNFLWYQIFVLIGMRVMLLKGKVSNVCWLYRCTNSENHVFFQLVQ